MKALRDIKIDEPDYMILTNYLDLIDDINKKIKEIEIQIDKRVAPDKDMKLLKVAVVHSEYFRYYYSKAKAKKKTNSAVVAASKKNCLKLPMLS